METNSINTVLKDLARNVRRIADAVCCQPPPEVQSGQAYTRKEAARLLGASVWLIDQARSSGELVEAETIGVRDVRITGASLKKFIQAKKPPGQTRVIKW